MKIDRLIIRNFRGISFAEAASLGDTIIIAGQNGSGKSCVFDAIRMLKSMYGGYQANEYQHFFNEFQIQLNSGPKNLRGLFNDLQRPVYIEVHFELREQEKLFISNNAKELLEETIWLSVLPEAFQYGGYHKAMFSSQFRDRQPEVDRRVADSTLPLFNELAQSQIIGRVEINTEGRFTLKDSVLLSLIFSNYRPREIGVIDFHGAQRHYGRESVQGINLNLDQAKQTYSQSTLYNYNNKYNNVKSEMAGSFIKEMLAEKAGTSNTGEGPEALTATLVELFEAFFPDKKFPGPRPTAEGLLSFPVLTTSGREHDLDDLSSGEKEILYGYLRIRSSAPRNSIILLDEPELHLNPRLIRGLPEFYRKHLGEALQNQLWLVTHSDALIREAVGKTGFNVFHMLPVAPGQPTSQLRPLTMRGDLEFVLTDLVGDLAAYRPGGKGLIFEGGGDSDFDKTMTSLLFSEELRGINLISGTNRLKVKSLHQILAKAFYKGDLPTKFYAITDSDTDEVEDTPAVNQYQWDVYHIENYLLDQEVISNVLNSLKLSKSYDAASVQSGLNKAARDVVPEMLIHKMRVYANTKIVKCIDFGFSPSSTNIGRDLSLASSRSLARIKNSVDEALSETELGKVERNYHNDIERSFSDGSWIKAIPGRQILKHFVSNEKVSVSYELFRNMILNRMAEGGIKPDGMKDVIEKIGAD